MMLSDANDITSGAVTPSQQAAWYDVIGQFESKAAQFQAAQADLQSQASFIATQPADVQAEYAALVAKGNTTASTIQTVQNALADVKNALTGAWSYVQGVWGNIANNAASYVVPEVDPATGLSPYAGLLGSSGLGFLPLIPIAIVAASVAALGYFLEDYLTFTKKIGLLKQGYTPAQVQQALGSSGGITSTLGWLVVGAGVIAAFVFLPRILREYKALR